MGRGYSGAAGRPPRAKCRDERMPPRSKGCRRRRHCVKPRPAPPKGKSTPNEHGRTEYWRCVKMLIVSRIPIYSTRSCDWTWCDCSERSNWEDFISVDLLVCGWAAAMKPKYAVFHKKTTPYLVVHNFGKCWPIFKIFSPSDSAEIV